MAIEALEAPVRNTGSKYDFEDADLKAAAKLLKEGKKPGQGGYGKEGEARSAATRLAEQLAAGEFDVGTVAASQLGSRVWEDDKGKWSFVLKEGKRKPNAETESGEAATE